MFFEQFSNIAYFREALYNLPGPRGQDILKCFGALYPENLVKTPLLPRLEYTRGVIIPALLPLPRDVTKIISQFLLPSSEFTFNDKVALNTFKKIFSKQPITHIYNPLAVIAEMEANVVKLQEEKESFLDMLEKSKAMKNLIALNDFLRDNNFNALSLLCPNFQGYTPIVLALKKDANNIADRIQVALQMEKDIKQIRALLIGSRWREINHL